MLVQTAGHSAMALTMFALSIFVLLSCATNAEIHSDVRKLKDTIQTLSRQLMLQQLFVEERIRSDGDSGVKQLRLTHKGTKSYYSDTYSRGSVLSIHDHSNYDRTVGMGEMIAVLNGVEFRTRHNDYKLRMPSKTTTTFHQLEDVPFPDVPPSVLSKHTVTEQINEMREYFRAFNEQNTHIRPYTNYFKPVLCYMEGAWTTDTKSLSEPFHSDRHFIDASSWFDLQEKIRYTSYTGGKSNLENYSFLPTTIIDIHNGEPVYAQWNYRIICHPVKTNVNLKDFHLIDDLGVRMANGRNMKDFSKLRSARFGLAGTSGYAYNSSLGFGKEVPKEYGHGLLDRIMQEIPGKDNYHANLHDFNQNIHEYDMGSNTPRLLNTGYYHRWFRAQQEGSRSSSIVHKGFSDKNLWTAQTTQPRVAPVTMRACHNSANHTRICEDHSTRYTYAIPLEMIWLTPLYKWNPYDLAFYTGSPRHAPANAVNANGRNGEPTTSKAFNGTNLGLFYHTPNEFFTGTEIGRDPADTAKDSVGVLDKHGHVRLVRASGTRIFLPDIKGVGKLRMRYPIPPTHFEGNAVWKEVDALKEMVMNMESYAKYFEKPISFLRNATGAVFQPDSHFKTSYTHRDPPGHHSHDVYLTHEEVAKLTQSPNNRVTVYTSLANGHQHSLEISKDRHAFIIKHCDGQTSCWDGHNNHLYLQSS